MNIKINKPLLSLITCSTAIILSVSCSGIKKEPKVTQDCSAMFETRYIDGNKQISAADKKKSGNTEEEAAMGGNYESQGTTECKVLEVQVDKDLRCEIVGSDKIDSLTKILEENRSNKLIFITPQEKIRELSQLAQKYLKSNGVDIEKYFSSDVTKNIPFPYKGMRCKVGDKEFVTWTGNKKVIMTLGSKQ